VGKACAISQPTWPTQPAIPPGSVNMSSDPLMMDYEGGDLLLAGAACAGYWVTAQGCVCRLGGDLNSSLAGQFQ